jgi:hypothetical protein
MIVDYQTHTSGKPFSCDLKLPTAINFVTNQAPFSCTPRANVVGELYGMCQPPEDDYFLVKVNLASHKLGRPLRTLTVSSVCFPGPYRNNGTAYLLSGLPAANGHSARRAIAAF